MPVSSPALALGIVTPVSSPALAPGQVGYEAMHPQSTTRALYCYSPASAPIEVSCEAMHFPNWQLGHKGFTACLSMCHMQAQPPSHLVRCPVRPYTCLSTMHNLCTVPALPILRLHNIILRLTQKVIHAKSKMQVRYLQCSRKNEGKETQVMDWKTSSPCTWRDALSGHALSALPAWAQGLRCQVQGKGHPPAGVALHGCMGFRDYRMGPMLRGMQGARTWATAISSLNSGLHPFEICKKSENLKPCLTCSEQLSIAGQKDHMQLRNWGGLPGHL